MDVPLFEWKSPKKLSYDQNICLRFWCGSIILWPADDNYSCSFHIPSLFTSCWILDQCALHIASARMLYCTHRAVGNSKDPVGMSSNVVGTIWPPWLRRVNWSAKIWGAFHPTIVPTDLSALLHGMDVTRDGETQLLAHTIFLQLWTPKKRAPSNFASPAC